MHVEPERHQIVRRPALRCRWQAARRHAERDGDQHDADHLVVDEGPEQAVGHVVDAAG